MLKDREKITDFYSYAVSCSDMSRSLWKAATFKKSLICHQGEKCLSFFVTYVSCFCREVSITIRLIKITLKTNVDFFHCLQKLTLDLDSDTKKFNIAVLFFFFYSKKTVILKTDCKVDKASQVTLMHSQH